ncbi:unnamed protein product, partial [Gulo gulo]
PTVRPAPCQSVQPARDTPCPVLGLGFPAGQGHAPPTQEPSPGPRWPRCGSGSQPWRPRPLPLTAPTVPSPSSPWLPAGSGEWVRAKRRPQPGAGPSTKLEFPSLKPAISSTALASSVQSVSPGTLTPTSSMSSVTASSASNCTEESAFTVTEPLLTTERGRSETSTPTCR